MPANVFEGASTPKICLIFNNGEFGSTDEAATARHLKQLGVNHCIGGPGAGQIPWTRQLDSYFLSHFRLIGFAGPPPGWRFVPSPGLYVRR